MSVVETVPGKPPKVHFHVCEACGHIWKDDRGDAPMTKEQNLAHHRCPKCQCGPYRSAFDTMRDALEYRRMLA